MTEWGPTPGSVGAHSDRIDPSLLEQLPTLPGTAVAFLRLCEDPTVGVAEVANVAQRDPALLARILQVANSPFYAPREPVTDGVRAAAILGLRNLKLIGVGFAILGDLWSSTMQSMQLAGIIGASAMAGSGAQSFSARFGTGRDEEALTAGLLSFVGELALLRVYPEEFAALWDQAGGLPSIADQRSAFGTHGAQVGVTLMERWSLPVGLRHGAVIRMRPMDERLERTTYVFDAALGFGTSIAELLIRGEKAFERVRPAARAWGLDNSDLMAYWSEFRLSVRRTNRQMGLDVGAELDSMIADARAEYMASMIHASSELETARREIEDLRADNERLESLSLSDPLTGIPNRPAFTTQLRRLLATAARDGGGFVGVVFFDLDGFKQVNDGLGHLTGDRVLQAVATAAVSAARTEELFARLGGDEFAMVLRPRSIEEIPAAAERVRRSMVAAASLDGLTTSTVSAGAAIIDFTGGDLTAAADQVTRAADDALYVAKREGRDRVALAASDVGATESTSQPTTSNPATS